MKRIILKLIAVFEILSGLGGFGYILIGMVGLLSFVVLPSPLFLIFCLILLMAGVLLLLRWKHAVLLSVLLQLLQVPYILTETLEINFGLPFANLTISGIWNAPDGLSATILGINFLALGVLLLLLWSRSALREVNGPDDASNKALQLTAR